MVVRQGSDASRRSQVGRGVLALLAVGALAAVLGSGSGAQGGGSLPLVGDELPSGDGADPAGYATGLGSHWNVLNWAPGELAAVPASFSKNHVDDRGRTVKEIMVSTAAQPDVATAESVTNMSFSLDSGRTFLTTAREYPVSALNMTRLNDGSLLTIEFVPQVATGTEPLRIQVAASADGTNWQKWWAPVTWPEGGPSMTSLRVHRRAMQLPDGTLMVPAYGTFVGERTSSSLILQSADGGESWTLRSRIPAPGIGGTNEVGWGYVVDGRLMAVMRTQPAPNSLVRSYSEDDGKTWIDAVPVKAPDGTPVQGIFPDLVLQPNGTLILLTGRPDVRMLVSYDGDGEEWDAIKTLFANYPSTGNNGRYDGTSGNTTMESVASNRSLAFYDQCHVWGCGAYDQQFGVSVEYAAAVTPGVGKIDVTTRLADGTAGLTTSGTVKADEAFPEMRPQGAFDASTARGAEAVLVRDGLGRPPSLTLKLDRAYTVDRIGLMLGHGEPQSAIVELSADGRRWSKPVVTATDRRDRAMRYTDVTAQKAGYVRVTGLGEQTTITEMEVYDAQLDTFENELPFAVPRGWVDAEHSWVTDVPDNVAYSDFGGDHSAAALRLWDKWTDSNATITREVAETDQLEATVQWGHSDLRTSFTVEAGSADGDESPWRFRVAAEPRSLEPRTIEAFDGDQWRVVGTLTSSIPRRTYVPLHISATATSATLTLNGEEFTTTTPAASASTFSVLTFTTGEPEEYGGIYYLDDVRVGD